MKKMTILTSTILLTSLIVTMTLDVQAADQTLPSAGKIILKKTNENGGNELALVKAPNVDFSEQPINGSEVTYTATIDPSAEFVQVDDNRGTNVGWSLIVANTQFKATSELTGAVLTIGVTAPTVENNNNVLSTTTYNAVADATIVLDGSNIGQPVANAAADTGMGINKIKYTDASLKVPGTTAKELVEYASDLTWTLSDAPI